MTVHIVSSSSTANTWNCNCLFRWQSCRWHCYGRRNLYFAFSFWWRRWCLENWYETVDHEVQPAPLLMARSFQEEALQRRSFGTDVTSIPEDYRSLCSWCIALRRLFISLQSAKQVTGLRKFFAVKVWASIGLALVICFSAAQKLNRKVKTHRLIEKQSCSERFC